MESLKFTQYFLKSNLFKTTSSLLIFSILIVCLSVTITPSNALIQGACNCVIFRLDDLQDDFVGPEQIAVMNKFIEKNEKVSLGIIMNDIGTDQSVISKVQEGHQSGLFELTLHGWMHVDYTTLSLANQKSTLQQASTKMQTIWGRNSTIFILPYNSYNTNTLQAMQDIGLKIISSEFDQELNLPDVYKAIPNSNIKDSHGVYHLPQVVEFYRQDVTPPIKNSNSTIMTSVTNTINQYGYAIVTLHPQDFAVLDSQDEPTNVVKTGEIDDLDTLITTIKNTGYTIKSFSDVTGVPLPPLVGGVPVTTANPSGGTYSTTQLVTLTASEPATIYYTTNGSTPTQSSSVYSSPISITTTTTLKFFAKDVDGNIESVKTQVYTIDSTPTFAIQYYSDSNLSILLGDNSKLKAGTYYLKITSNEALSGTPTISINAEGTANDATNASTTLVSGNNYRYTRVIVSDVSALGTTLENISITGTDTSANTATNVNPTNEVTKAAYTDTVSPSIVLSTPENPTNDESFVVTAQFSEPVTGVAIADFVVIGGTKSNFIAVDADTYTVTVTKTANSITINMASSTSTDIAGNANTAAGQLTVTFDNTIPTVTVSTITNPTNINPIPMTVTFSEPVTGFAEGDITVTGGTVTAASLTTLDNTVYNFTITPTDNGTILVNIAANAATDGVNGNGAATQFSIGYDGTNPTVVLSTPENPTNDSPFTITAQFSEPVTGVTIDDFTVAGGTKSNFVAIDSDTYTINVIPSANSITIDMASNTSYDLAGNSLIAATQVTVTFDNTPPTVTLSTPLNPTPRPAFTITAQFSEPVTDVTIDDFVVTNGVKSNFVALDADTYSIRVTKTTSSVTIDMASSSSFDFTGNGNTATNLVVNFDPQANTSNLCSPPQLQSDNWIIQSNCMIIDDVIRTGNVEIQNSAVLTIENGASLNIDFVTHFLKVHSGSGVLIKSGGKIN